jgi:hypothetical protein
MIPTQAPNSNNSKYNAYKNSTSGKNYMSSSSLNSSQKKRDYVAMFSDQYERDQRDMQRTPI